MPNLEQHEYLKTCVNTMLDISGLSDQDRKDLDAIKKSLETPATTRDQEILSTKNILASLEKRVDQMQAIDKKKLLDVQQALKEHTSDLASLKADVLDPQKKIDEYKKKTFDTIKQDLEKHWRTAWLAGPINTYLTEKYIDKKPVSAVKEWLAKYIGIPLLGLFLPKTLTTVLENLESGSLNTISDIEQTTTTAINTLGTLGVEKIHDMETAIAPGLQKSFEKLVGHPIDSKKFNATFSVWINKWKGDITLANENLQQLASTGTGNPLDIIAKYLVIGPKASFDLIVSLADAKLISWDSLAIESVERSGKTIFRMGMSSFGLFSRYFDCIFGELSPDELTEYVKNNVSGISLDSKAAIWGLLYRHGGIFWNLMGKVGSLAGNLTHYALGSNAGNISKFSAYRNSGVAGNVNRELKIISELEQSLLSTGMMSGQNYNKTTSVLQGMVDTLKKNTQIFAIAQEAKSPQLLLSSLKSAKITHIGANVIDDSLLTKFKTLPELKSFLGSACSIEMAGNLDEGTKSFGIIKKTLAKIMPKTPWSKYPLETELIDLLKAHSATQEKLLKSDKWYQKVTKMMAKFQHGKNLTEIIEHGDKVKFHLKNVTEAKEFFDNVAYIGKSSPEILKTLFKGFPLIMVGKEVLDSVFAEDPDKQNKGLLKTIGTAMAYITPIVGPAFLVYDSLVLNDWKATDLAGAGIGVGMFAYDTICAVKTFGVRGGFLKYMTSPIRDSVSFVRSLGQGTYTMFKMSKDLLSVAKVEGLGALGKAGFNYLKKVGFKTAVLALFVFLGYLTRKEFFDGMSEEEKKMFAGLQDKSPEEREKWIAEQWKTMPDDQKALFLKVASAQRLGFQDPELVDVKKEGSIYIVKVKQLVSASQLAQAKSELQQAVDQAEGITNKTLIQYTLDGGALEARLEAMTKDGSTKDQIKAYLLELGYPVQDVDQMITKI